MSGGSLNYFYCELQDHDKDFGDKELNELVSDLADLFHAREWYLSSDTGVGDWNEARDRFKAKWFTLHGRQERIEKYLDEIAEEVRESFGMSRRHCQHCKHWTEEEKGETYAYGRCPFTKGYVHHRSAPCDCGRFEPKETSDAS